MPAHDPNKVPRSLVDRLKSEPLRVRVYAIGVLVAGYLVARGMVSVTDSEFIESVGVLVLGVETARAKVTPTAAINGDDGAGDLRFMLLILAVVGIGLLLLGVKFD